MGSVYVFSIGFLAIFRPVAKRSFFISGNVYHENLNVLKRLI